MNHRKEDVIEAIEGLLAYLWKDEEQDYMCSSKEMRAAHVFRHLVVMKTFARELRGQGTTDSEALGEIQKAMTGQEWSPDTLDAIAEILDRAGRRIESPD